MSIAKMQNDFQHIEGLLFEKLAGTISAADDQFLEKLMAEDEEWLQRWTDMRRNFESPAGRAFLSALDEDHAWEKVKPPLSARTRALPVTMRRLSFWLAAAILLVAIGVHFYFYRDSPTMRNVARQNRIALKLENGQVVDLDSKSGATINLGAVQLKPGREGLTYSTQATQQWSTLEIPATKDYKISLSDGTEVRMNAASKLRFPFQFTDSVREVYLEGEAYFKVTPDINRPFFVHAGNTTVRVLGTSFNINAYEPDRVETALVEGSVLATAGSRQVTLEPGYRALAAGAADFRVTPFDPDAVLAWMDGSYYFHNQPLHDISKTVERWFGITVVFHDAKTASLRFTGVLQKQKPLDYFIANLQLSSPIHADLVGDTLYFK